MDIVERERSAVDPLREAFAVEVLHGDVEAVVELAVVEDAGNPLAALRTQLAQPRAPLPHAQRVPRAPGPPLQPPRPARARVDGQKDVAHAAFADRSRGSERPDSHGGLRGLDTNHL